MNSAAANTLVAGLVPYLKDPWTLSWIVSGLLAIFIPITIWSVHRNSYFNSYGSYIQAQDYYDNAKRYYEQQQQNNNNYYNNNGNGNNNYYGNQSNYKECSWINWPCRKRQWRYATYNQDNNGEGNNQQMPSWFIFFGGETEQMQRWREENTEEGAEGGRRNQSAGNGGGLNFVYFLTLGLFLTLFVFGAMVINKRNTPASSTVSTTGAGSLMNMTHLTVFLVITIIIALMNLIMTVGILSSGDEKDNEDSYYGWYGQTAVLVAYTDFWMMLFSFSFLVAFQIKNYINANYNGEREAQTQQLDIHNAFTEERRNGGDYHAPAKV